MDFYWSAENLHYFPEPEFVNVSGPQESIPRNQIRLHIEPVGQVRQIGWESIPGLLKRFANSGSGVEDECLPPQQNIDSKTHPI